MRRTVKEGQVVIAGRIGNMEKRTDSLVSISIANRVSKEETQWERVALVNPKSGKGARLADLAAYLVVGQYVTVICNEVSNEEKKNLYVQAIELGPKPRKETGEEEDPAC